jgi:hypothetical protein
MITTELLKNRLMKYTAVTPECWNWTGSKSGGYGMLMLTDTKAGIRKLEKAHRVSWFVHFGPIPYGIQVLHTCDNPS